MTSFSYWCQAARPRTLPAALAPVLVGWCLALEKSLYTIEELFSVLIFASGLTLSLQIATNFFNDALDSDRGTDRATRLGPPRMCATGKLSSKSLKKGALICCLIASIFGLPLVVMGGPLFLLIGLVCLSLTYLYTGTNYSISYHGLGELFVFIFFGIIPVACISFLGHYSWSPESFLIGIQIGCLCTHLISINNLRDEEDDALSRKKTLVVKLGRNTYLKYLKIITIACYILSILIVLYNQSLWLGELLFLLSFPLVWLNLKKVSKTKPSKIYNQYLGSAAKNLLVGSLLLSIGVMVVCFTRT